MIPQFANLSEAETQLMHDAIPMITVLIAGADGNIDPEETAWAEKLTNIRSYSFHESLQPFYEKVGETFSDKTTDLIKSLPGSVNSRTETISAELSKLNGILANLEPEFAKRYYDSLVSFAKHVAKADGGFLGFGSISKEEAALIELPMITPIVLDDEEA